MFGTAYTARQIKDRNLDIYYLSRDAAQLFNRIISVNPIAEIQDKIEGFEFQYPKITSSGKLTMVEGGVFEGKTLEFRVYTLGFLQDYCEKNL